VGWDNKDNYNNLSRRFLMKKIIVVLLTILMLFTLFQGASRENVVKANSTPIWPMFHYNAQHTGQCPYDTSRNNGTLKWKYKAGFNSIDSSPIISSDGTIYIGDFYYLYAINPDGTLKWKFGIGDRTLYSSPAISEDGTIYVVDHNYLYAINPDGTLKWKYETGWSIPSPTISEDGTIYIWSNHNYLEAINPDGTLKWKYRTRSGLSTYSSPAIGSDGTIYIGSGDGYLYAINPDGTLKWRYREEGDPLSGYLFPTISKDGTIYVVSYAYLSAINPNGTLKWKRKIGYTGINWSSPAISKDGTIYVVDHNHLYAINPDGTLKWKYEPDGDLSVHSSPIISSDGTIYVGGDDYLYAINPDGTLKWQYETGHGYISSSPAISKDGTIYATDSIYLYAIGSTGETHCIITASAGTGGSISPSGNITVNYGDSKTFIMTPNSGYKISTVKVDGVSKGVISSHTFTNITANHTIEAIFEEEKKETVIILQIGNSSFTVNGIPNTLDSPPVIKNSRTLLPIRAIIESLGGSVSWDATERKVTVSLGSITIELWIGKYMAKVNGVDTPIDPENKKVVPEIISSRTMLPLRFVTENLGCDVKWDGTTKTITITYPKP
jgi:outer membrane protein assembly factor BamB